MDGFLKFVSKSLLCLLFQDIWHFLLRSSEKSHMLKPNMLQCVKTKHYSIQILQVLIGCSMWKARGGRIFNYSLRLHGYIEQKDKSLNDRLRWRRRKTGRRSILICFFLLNWCLHLGVQSCFKHDHTCWDTHKLSTGIRLSTELCCSGCDSSWL